MTLTGHAPQTFRASVSSTVTGVIGIVVATLVLDVVAGIATLLLLRSMLPAGDLNHLLTAVLVVVPLVGLVLVVRRITSRWVIVDGELREESFGRAWRRWDLATTTVRWNATRRLTNGVYQGTTRTLILQPFGGAERRVVPWRFDALRFTELLTALSGPELPTPRDDAAVDREYAVSRGRLTRMFVGQLIAAVIAAVVVCAVVYFLAQQDPPQDRATAFAELLLPPLLGALFIGWIVGRGIQRGRGVPRRVRVTRDGVTVDGVQFAYIALAQVLLTPPYDGPGEREIVFVDGAGARTRFSLTGAAPATAAMTTVPPVQAPYALFVHEVLQGSAWRGPGFVQYLRG